MKVHVLFKAEEGPFGGGNQFLKALSGAFEARGIRAPLADADLVLFNSFDAAPFLLRARAQNPKALFVHRVDGPISLYNREADPRDWLVFAANAVFADATVFQSVWSRDANLRRGLSGGKHTAVIGNAPDPAVFFPKEAKTPATPPRIIATSWSSNVKKGFETYRWLDEHLDFTRWEMTFVGRSPIPFRNIVVKAPMPSAALADELRAHDIFLTASQKDPCSNSLIEALHCGLPAVALRDGGHPEIVARAGVLFSSCEEIPSALEEIVARYGRYADAIETVGIDEIARKYQAFFSDLLAQQAAGALVCKRVGFAGKGAYCGMRMLARAWEPLHRFTGKVFR
jgi:glycosyltransferase involved in cell wall biosynthesis